MSASPRAHLSRRYRFSASHRLHVNCLSADRNREIFGKCNNPFGHGHNYFVEVMLVGPIDAETGMVANLAELDDFAERELLARFDCANLNADPAFAECVSSTENLCIEVWRVFDRFAAHHSTAKLERIRIEETNNNTFDYFGEDAPSASVD